MSYVVYNWCVVLLSADATLQQIDEVKLYIERILMGYIYTHALYPNGDGDQMRDM